VGGEQRRRDALDGGHALGHGRAQPISRRADQGARLTAQQAQLEILQQKLAAETKTADQLAAQNEGTPAPVTNRVIAVEPASGASEPAANAAATAPGPEPTPNSTPPETKVATVESNPAEVKTPPLCLYLKG